MVSTSRGGHLEFDQGQAGRVVAQNEEAAGTPRDRLLVVEPGGLAAGEGQGHLLVEGIAGKIPLFAAGDQDLVAALVDHRGVAGGQRDQPDCRGKRLVAQLD